MKQPKHPDPDFAYVTVTMVVAVPKYEVSEIADLIGEALSGIDVMFLGSSKGVTEAAIRSGADPSSWA